jgi:hypothetical protein
MNKMATDKNLITDEKVKAKIRSDINKYFDLYKTQRDEIDTLNKIADYMYECAQNRTLESAEKSYGMNMDADTRSNVGSVLFHRIINQLAALLESVMLSKPDLFVYKTFSNEEDISTMDGEKRAEMCNLLARWTLKQDQFIERLPSITRMLYKRSNIFAQVLQVREERKITVKEPVYERVEDVNGEAQTIITGEKDVTETKIVKNYPSIQFPPVDSIYLDRFIADMQQQPCVVIRSLKTKAQIYHGVVNEWYDQDAYEEFSKNTKKYRWDGETGRDALRDKEEQSGGTYSPEPQDNLFLMWDVYLDMQVNENGEVDEQGEAAPEKYWITMVGNTAGDAMILRVEPNPEPDGEIPLKDIHVYPDDGDRMYHSTIAGIARSSYSADCTLMNLLLDNLGLANDPPKEVVEGQHNVKDFTYKKGAVWHVYQKGAISPLPVQLFTQDTVGTQNEVEKQLMMALSVDKGFVGESQGARTSASEATFINRNSMQPHLSQIRYILMQLLPWMGRKYMSYWQAYGDPSQVAQITDDNKQYHRISPTEVAGEFDVKIEIIDEYESDMLKSQALENILNIVASNEWLHQSETEEIDGPALLREIIKAQKVDPSLFIRSRSGGDSERTAQMDVERILYMGEDVPINPDSNLRVHLRVKEQALTQWKGIEQDAIAKGVRVDLLQQHVAQLKQAIAGGGQGAPQQQQQQSQEEPPALPQEAQTMGQAGGNQIAEAMGGMQ